MSVLMASVSLWTKSLSHCSGLEMGTVVCLGVTSYFMSRMLCGISSLSIHLACPGKELLTYQIAGAMVIKGPVFFASCTWVSFHLISGVG